MAKARWLGVGVAAWACMTGCGRSGAGDAGVPPDATFVAGHSAHAMPMFGESAADQMALDPYAATPELRYWGGHVLSHAKVVAVLWGTKVDPQVVSGIGGFYSAVLDSPYLDWLSEYDTDVTPVGGGAGTGQHIGRGSFAGARTIAPSSHAHAIDDVDVQRELAAQIAAGKLPAPDADTLYMTYFPAGTVVTQGGGASCVDFCAYHGTFRHAGKSVAYGVVPDFGPGSGCDAGCGTGTTFEDVTTASSHELAEAITDAEVGLATTDGPPLAWYDIDNGEIGDICAGKTGRIAGYIVQREWDDGGHACILSKAGPGTVSDFALVLAPASRSVPPGGSTSVTVTTQATAGAAESIALTVAGLPPGVTATLAPATVLAGQSATLMLDVATSAPAGTGSFSVKGTAGATVRSAAGSLVVTGLAGEGEQVVNGGFEGAADPWERGGSKLPIVSTAEAHGGNDSLRLGATGSTEPDGDSWVAQRIAIPATAEGATLTFWCYFRSDDTLAHDWQTAEVRDEAGNTLQVLFKTASDTRTWVEHGADLSAYRGRTIQLWFDVDSNGGTTPTTMWLDDVSLVAP